MLIPFICLFMGLGAMGVSCYYSFLWFIQRGMPIWIAVIIALVYVGFANIVFEYAINYFEEYKIFKRKLLTVSKKATNYKVWNKQKIGLLVKFVYSIAGWSLLAIFSMYCTVGGQYEQLMVFEGDNKQEIAYQDYTKTIMRKEKQLADYEKEKEQIINRNASVTSIEERWDYKNTTASSEQRLDMVRSNIQTLTEELEVLEEKQALYTKNEALGISNRSFFVYVSDIVKNKWPANIIQFWSALFPSIVIDIISPICITIFVLSWRRRKK